MRNMKAITGATMIDGTGKAPVRNATVVIDGDRITAAGAKADVQVPRGAETIDAKGMHLLPGLIDCHDHLANFNYQLVTRWRLNEPHSLWHLRIAHVLKQTLETGYTTVQDASGLDAGFKMAVEEGIISGPRLLVALDFITPTAGMADRTSPSGAREVHQLGSLPRGVADGPEQMRIKVREFVREGADVIKTATTNEGWSSPKARLGPKTLLMSRAELEALVDEAHTLGRRVMCHALGGPGLRAAVEVGVDSIEHGAYLDQDPELLTMMREKNIFFTPTFSVFVHHGAKGNPHAKAIARAFRDHQAKSLQMAIEAGVKVASGSDEGGWEHGNNAHEIRCLVEAGMTPMQAIVAATGNAAECLRLDRELGTITPGKKADLILVNGDPLKDVTILEWGKAVKFVMKDGTVYVDRRSQN
jgi:imidazolonepropionase-like amidohydrolase